MIHANFKEELEARRSIVKWGKDYTIIVWLRVAVKYIY